MLFEERTGKLIFDNFSQYDEKHPEVVAGRRKIGEEGHWGDHKLLYGLLDEYAAQTIYDTAQRLGHRVKRNTHVQDGIALTIEVG